MDEFKKNAVLLRTLLLFMSTYLYICSMYVRIKRKYDEGIENDKEKENGEHAIDDPLREDAGRMNGFQKKKRRKNKSGERNPARLFFFFSQLPTTRRPTP